MQQPSSQWTTAGELWGGFSDDFVQTMRQLGISTCREFFGADRQNLCATHIVTSAILWAPKTTPTRCHHVIFDLPQCISEIFLWLRLFPLRFSLSWCSNLLEAHYDRRWNNCCHTSARNTTKPSLILSKRFSHENILSANYKRPRMKSMFLYSKCNLNFDKCFCRILTIQNVQANCKSCWVN